MPGSASPEGDKPEVLNFVQAQIPVANRAPTSKDLGLFWLHDKITTLDLYARSKISGKWCKVALS